MNLYKALSQTMTDDVRDAVIAELKDRARQFMADQRMLTDEKGLDAIVLFACIQILAVLSDRLYEDKEKFDA